MRSTFIFFVLFVCHSVLSQDVTNLSDDILPKKIKWTTDSKTLVNQLIAGKGTDQEKFDVIFTWVLKNIRYDYQKYKSNEGTYHRKIENILKSRKGICLDYAELMDSLCFQAGLKNVTIYGYAKDEIFDINDPLYMDNHAWNSVRIDDKWYVYDVTWSAGQYTQKLTKISNFFFQLNKKIHSKTSTKSIKIKVKKSECSEKKMVFKKNYQELSSFRKILCRILSLKKLKYKVVFSVRPNFDFYLTQPEVFAITHFPDNPYWSLIPGYSKIKTFESDIAYYNLDSNTYKNQVRDGKECIDCDNYLTLSELNRYKELKKNSFEFNKDNHFISFLCDYEIGSIYLENSKLGTDTTIRLKNIDTALMTFSHANKEIEQSLKFVGKDANYQKNKNKKKVQLLRTQNEKHMKLNLLVNSQTSNRNSKLKKLKNKNSILLSKYTSKRENLKNTNKEVIHLSIKPKAEQKIINLQNKLNKTIAKTDSINSSIDQLTADYKKKIALLSENIWGVLSETDSLNKFYYEAANKRSIYFLDNYKKIINDDQIVLNNFEKQYHAYIRENIVLLSDSCEILHKKISSSIPKKNDQIFKSVKTIKSLIQENILGTDSLNRFIESNKTSIQNNICWIIENEANLKLINRGFSELSKKQKSTIQLIKLEIKAEVKRSKKINLEVDRRKNKFTGIPKSNLKVLTLKNSDALSEKNKLLKK